jgi:hypothetical protein
VDVLPKTNRIIPRRGNFLHGVTLRPRCEEPVCSTGGYAAFLFPQNSGHIPGRLRKLTHAEEGVVGVYDYDANGFRVRSEANGVMTYYIRDGAGQVDKQHSFCSFA